jgi:hypothetical protein
VILIAMCSSIYEQHYSCCGMPYAIAGNTIIVGIVAAPVICYLTISIAGIT